MRIVPVAGHFRFRTRDTAGGGARTPVAGFHHALPVVVVSGFRTLNINEVFFFLLQKSKSETP